MKKMTIVLFILSIMTLIFMQGISYLIPILWKNWETTSYYGTDSSKSHKTTLKIAGDMWLGYTIFRSPQFIEKMERAEIQYQFVIENNFQKRFEGLGGEYDLVVSTVDSYVRNGKAIQYRGQIIFAIDESAGGDGVVALPPYSDIDKLNDPKIHIGVVPDSPSEYLLNVLITNFNLSHLTLDGPWKVACENEKDLFLKLRDGKINVGVVWEPYLSRCAREIPGAKLLTNTRDCDDLIIDVAIADKKALKDKSWAFNKFFAAYFEVLDYFKANPAEFKTQVKREAELDEDGTQTALRGIEFIDFAKNGGYWFGAGEGGGGPTKMCRVIENSQEVFNNLKIQSKIIKDPYALIGFEFFQGYLNQQGVKVISAPAEKSEPFANLGDDFANWEKNTVRVGTIQTKPIYFQSGQSLLTLEGKSIIDELARLLLQFPRYRIIIQGFTSPEGDMKASLTLSDNRAGSIRSYLERTWKFHPHRLLAKGFGQEKVLPRLPDEGKRSWLSRNQRVEFLLVRDP